jgi:hypothetical protein
MLAIMDALAEERGIERARCFHFSERGFCGADRIASDHSGAPSGKL